MTEWTFDFDWSKPPLSLNYRMHHMQAAKLTKEIRGLICTRAAHLPVMRRCEVSLTWFVNTRTRRDDENPVPTLKALCDGIVDAGIVPDDTNEFMKKLMPVIVYRRGEPASMRLTIRDIGEENDYPGNRPAVSSRGLLLASYARNCVEVRLRADSKAQVDRIGLRS
ncbi:hypothetical protein [Leucobacter japonicus]|uniref:hypothetical protein n=1 Tax=Leucobacter japonicus TaxID=1461259 RepID=UPI000949A70F|nr:hypothetical protein [Leucobacter japonicus]